MLKRIITFFLITIYCFSAHATSKAYLDSVQHVLDTTQNPKQKLLCLYTLGYENGLINPRKAIELAWQCMALAKSQQDTFYILNAYNALGNAYETLADFDSAEYFHTKSYHLAVLLKSRPTEIVTLSNAANCMKLQGNYKVALQQYLTVYKLMESEPVYNFRVHYAIADLYLKIGDYQKAIEHARYGIHKIEQGNDESSTLILYLTLGKALLYSGKSDSALIVINNTVEKLKYYTDEASLGAGLNILGEIYLTKKMYHKALQVFSEELPIETKLNNKNGILLSQVNIVYCNTFLKKKLQTTTLFLKNIEQQLEGVPPNSETLLDIYKKLSDTYGLIGNNAKAYYYARRYSTLNDSLLNRDKFKQIIDLQTQFESEKVNSLLKQQKAQLQIQASDIQKRRLQLVYLITAFILIIAAGFYGYSRFKTKQKIKMLLAMQHQEKEKEQAIKEKEMQERIRISKDIHDELGAGISKISMMAEYSKQQLDKTETLQDTMNVIARTSQEVADNMHDLVWSLNSENTTLDNLVARIREYAGDYLEEFPIDVTFTFPDDIPPMRISKEFQRNVFMTCKEAINNAVKHASAKNITIHVELNACHLKIEIADDGRGISEERKRLTGNGLRNMQQRIESVGGTFNLIATNGVKVCMNIPVKNQTSG